MPLSQNTLTFQAVGIKDICVFNSNNVKCMLQSKILQKNLIDMCTKKDKKLRNLFLNPKSAANKDTNIQTSSSEITGSKKEDTLIPDTSQPHDGEEIE